MVIEWNGAIQATIFCTGKSGVVPWSILRFVQLSDHNVSVSTLFCVIVKNIYKFTNYSVEIGYIYCYLFLTHGNEFFSITDLGRSNVLVSLCKFS